MEVGHFDKLSRTTRGCKASLGKNLRFIRLETLKKFILDEKIYPYMTTIRAFFLQIRAIFSNFRKRAAETSPPASPPVTRLNVQGQLWYLQ